MKLLVVGLLLLLAIAAAMVGVSRARFSDQAVISGAQVTTDISEVITASFALEEENEAKQGEDENDSASEAVEGSEDEAEESEAPEEETETPEQESETNDEELPDESEGE
jgi:hypothetical protein